MFTTGCHPPLAAVGPSPPHASFRPRRWRQAAAPAPLPVSTTASRRALLVSPRAAINIPPDALVHPLLRKTFGSDDSPWGIEKVDKTQGEAEKVRIWLLLAGIDETKVNEEVEVDLPHRSNVLTIKKMKDAATADDLLDVRLLLTAGYSRDGIMVEKEKYEGKVRLEVTIIRNITEFRKINIK